MKKEIRRVLKEARRARGETQAQVARRLGISQQLVSYLERGEGSVEQFAKLCRGLGVPLSLRAGDETITLVHPIDPEERREIDENIAWFSRLAPAARLRTIRRHVKALERLRTAAATHGE